MGPDSLERRRALARALHAPSSRLAAKLEQLRQEIEWYQERAAALQARLEAAR